MDELQFMCVCLKRALFKNHGNMWECILRMLAQERQSILLDQAKCIDMGTFTRGFQYTTVSPERIF